MFFDAWLLVGREVAVAVLVLSMFFTNACFFAPRIQSVQRSAFFHCFLFTRPGCSGSGKLIAWFHKFGALFGASRSKRDRHGLAKASIFGLGFNFCLRMANASTLDPIS